MCYLFVPVSNLVASKAQTFQVSQSQKSASMCICIGIVFMYIMCNVLFDCTIPSCECPYLTNDIHIIPYRRCDSLIVQVCRGEN